MDLVLDVIRIHMYVNERGFMNLYILLELYFLVRRLFFFPPFNFFYLLIHCLVVVSLVSIYQYMYAHMKRYIYAHIDIYTCVDTYIYLHIYFFSNFNLLFLFLPVF